MIIPMYSIDVDRADRRSLESPNAHADTLRRRILREGLHL
jgi:hypothetical protein